MHNLMPLLFKSGNEVKKNTVGLEISELTNRLDSLKFICLENRNVC